MAGPIQMCIKLNDADLFVVLLQGPANRNADGVISTNDDGNRACTDYTADRPLNTVERIIPVPLQHVGIAAVGNGNRSRQHLLIGFVVVISLGSASILCGGLPNPSWAHARPAQKADSHVEGNPQHTKVRIQSIQIKADRIPSKRTNSGDRLTDQFRPHRTFLFPANFIWLGFSLLYCICNYICFPVDL